MKKDEKTIDSQTLYLKYRPKDFDEVIGQEEVVSVVEKSINEGKISHAYLFSGTHGTGKTSMARIFAKKIGASDDDIYEIDAASNRGIGDIREIRETVDILPTSSKFKVYIIDEAHMLTKEASNALLKTLEEPPKYVVFILATTEKNKVLPTILSRCSVFQFKSPDISILSKLIKKVVKKENREIDDESVEFLASLGNKSFRDTLSNLQKVFSVCDKKISIGEINKIFSSSVGSYENDFLLGVVNKDKEKIFQNYFNVNEDGIELNNFLNNIIGKIRKSLLIKNSKLFFNKYQKELTETEFEFLNKIEINSKILKDFLSLQEKIKLSSNPKILFEIFIDQLF